MRVTTPKTEGRGMGGQTDIRIRLSGKSKKYGYLQRLIGHDRPVNIRHMRQSKVRMYPESDIRMRYSFLNISCLILLSINLLHTQTPLYNNNDPGDPFNPDIGLVNGRGTGVGGADESVVQTVSLGMETFGFGQEVVTFDNTIADDFILFGGNNEIDSMRFFAYQDGSTTTSSIDGIYVRIWDGQPNAFGSKIIFGDLTTNRLGSTRWAGIYRVTEATSGFSTERPVMIISALTKLRLDQGQYWLEWGTSGKLKLGPWAPPLTIEGMSTTGDALQSLEGNAFMPVLDGGTLTGQGFPFVIYGKLGAIPTMGEWSLVVLALLLLIAGTLVLRARSDVDSQLGMFHVRTPE